MSVSSRERLFINFFKFKINRNSYDSYIFMFIGGFNGFIYDMWKILGCYDCMIVYVDICENRIFI